ncbi:unnamed protein product [Paramecium sonneborni]|uniref:Uncharacterized protein n=1 Tax=Paramecium sonneborni TaxID=65129 RepID=A0A8S1KWL8_9CILI|nr:unnamed protein product [Paramecium sonneborni]
MYQNSVEFAHIEKVQNYRYKGMELKMYGRQDNLIQNLNRLNVNSVLIDLKCELKQQIEQIQRDYSKVLITLISGFLPYLQNPNYQIQVH